MNLRKLVISKNDRLINFSLTTLSAILLSLPWIGCGVFTIFFAFIPILFLAERTKTKRGYIGWVFIFNAIWVVLTQYWVGYATVGGVIACVIVNFSLFFIPFLLYKFSLEKSYRSLAATIFVSSWIALEYLYTHNTEISHPWIILGNGFAESIKIIQWYEFTGVFGGSLWVLIINFLLYIAIRTKKTVYFKATGVILFLPIFSSFIIYSYYSEDNNNKVSVSVIQPNIDPYKEKFGSLNQRQQDNIIQTLIKQSPKDIDYIICPETALSDNINIDKPHYSNVVSRYTKLMETNYPNSELIIGASMYKLYQGESTAPTITARKTGAMYYDCINGALQIGKEDIDTYIKSKLVCGVEQLPFPEYLHNLKIGSIDLGGMSGALITQDEREGFTSTTKENKEVNIATLICYESIYGEYITEFVKNGSQAIFIITNDGWWRDTHGHRQHFNYARLRAIETRRSIARSANTGISGFINQRGDVVQSLGWDKRDILIGEVALNDKITVYAKYGDLIGRIARLVMLLSIVYFIAYTYKKKSNLN